MCPAVPMTSSMALERSSKAFPPVSAHVLSTACPVNLWRAFLTAATASERSSAVAAASATPISDMTASAPAAPFASRRRCCATVRVGSSSKATRVGTLETLGLGRVPRAGQRHRCGSGRVLRQSCAKVQIGQLPARAARRKVQIAPEHTALAPGAGGGLLKPDDGGLKAFLGSLLLQPALRNPSLVGSTRSRPSGRWRPA